MSDDEENPQPKVITAKMQQQLAAANIADSLKGLELAGHGFETGNAEEMEQGLKVLDPYLKTFDDHRTLLTAVDWGATALAALGIGGNVTKALSNINEFTTSDGLAEKLADFREERVQEVAQQSPTIAHATTIDAPPAAGHKPQGRGQGNGLA